MTAPKHSKAWNLIYFRINFRRFLLCTQNFLNETLVLTRSRKHKSLLLPFDRTVKAIFQYLKEDHKPIKIEMEAFLPGRKLMKNSLTRSKNLLYPTDIFLVCHPARLKVPMCLCPEQASAFVAVPNLVSRFGLQVYAYPLRLRLDI